MITARSQYDDRPVLASDISFEGDKGLTKQADAKDADINYIMKRFERTGQLPDMIVRDGRYGDFSEVPDYQEALHIVQRANEQFENLDANIRNRFDNDPAKFLGFVNDPKNEDELAKMGLLNKEAMDRREARQLAELKKAQEAEAVKAAAVKKAAIDEIKAALAA